MRLLPAPLTGLPQTGLRSKCKGSRISCPASGLISSFWCRRLAESDFRGHPDIRLMVMYSEALAHLIYAAADIVLVGTP